jgi:hypothetical protein
MAIDANASAQGLSNLLFAQQNATATISTEDLAAIATAIDAQMTSDITAFVAAMPATFQALNATQQNQAMAYVAMKRAGLA